MSGITLQGHTLSLLKQLNISFELHEEVPFFVLATTEEEHYFCVKVHKNAVTVTLWNLMPQLDINDPKLSAFYLSLLLDQDTTQQVKYSISIDNELEISIDLPAHHLTLKSLQDAVENLISASEERLPLIVEPFIDIIFKDHLQEESQAIEEIIN